MVGFITRDRHQSWFERRMHRIKAFVTACGVTNADQSDPDHSQASRAILQLIDRADKKINLGTNDGEFTNDFP